MWSESCVGEGERSKFILEKTAHRTQESQGTVRATYSVAHSMYLQEQEGPKVPFYSAGSETPWVKLLSF